MEALLEKNTEVFIMKSATNLDYDHGSFFYQYFNLQQEQCLVTGHKQTALKVSQVQGGRQRVRVCSTEVFSRV